MAKVQLRDANWEPALGRLRALCLELPGAGETLTYGNPTFKVGKKPFAVLDNYAGETCVWARCEAAKRAHFLADPGCFAAPYDRAQTALCWKVEGMNWPALSDRLRESHALALLS